MSGEEFIEMMRRDIETDPSKEDYVPVLEVMEYVVNGAPGCEIQPEKNVKDAFGLIKAAAMENKKKTKGMSYGFVGHSEAVKIISDYLGIQAGGGKAPAAAVRAVSLEDFL